MITFLYNNLIVNANHFDIKAILKRCKTKAQSICVVWLYRAIFML